MVHVVHPVHVVPQTVAAVHDDARRRMRVGQRLRHSAPAPIETELSQRERAERSAYQVDCGVAMIQKRRIDVVGDDVNVDAPSQQVGGELCIGPVHAAAEVESGGHDQPRRCRHSADGIGGAAHAATLTGRAQARLSRAGRTFRSGIGRRTDIQPTLRRRTMLCGTEVSSPMPVSAKTK